MKSNGLIYSAITLLLTLPLFLGCKGSLCIDNHNRQYNVSSKLDSIVVSYLNWNLMTQGALSCEDVRNYNNGRNAVFVIKDKKVIKSIVESMSLIEMDFIMSKQKSDTRMVMDFYIGDEIVKEICLNRNRAIFHEGNLYRSFDLYMVIEEEIPKTNAPHPNFRPL